MHKDNKKPNLRILTTEDLKSVQGGALSSLDTVREGSAGTGWLFEGSAGTGRW